MGSKFVLGILAILLVISLLGVNYFMPFNELEFTANPRNYNFSVGGSSDDMQFYPNMRFRTENISYKIIDCSLSKQGNMLEAFDILENETMLNFYPVASGEDITVTCDEMTKFKGNMFIAGEGGPTKIVRAGEYYVILTGTILLIKESKCPNPNVGIHELLHVLGFIHSNNANNIMYNFTSCRQTIGDEIPQRIDEIYSIPAQPNLVLENASASMSGRYLDLEFSVRNNGFAESQPAIIQIKMGDSVLKEVEIKSYEVGSGQIINLGNIFVSRLSMDGIELIIDYELPELNKEDNSIFLEIKK